MGNRDKITVFAAILTIICLITLFALMITDIKRYPTVTITPPVNSPIAVPDQIVSYVYAGKIISVDIANHKITTTRFPNITFVGELPLVENGQSMRIIRRRSGDSFDLGRNEIKIIDFDYVSFDSFIEK